MVTVAFLEMVSIGLVLPLIHMAFFQSGGPTNGGVVAEQINLLFEGIPPAIIAITFCGATAINVSILAIEIYYKIKTFSITEA